MGTFFRKPPPGGRHGPRSKGHIAVSVMATVAVGLGFSILSVAPASAVTGTPPYHFVVSVASPQVVDTVFDFTANVYDSSNTAVTDCGNGNMDFSSDSVNATFTATQVPLGTDCSVSGSVSFNAPGTYQIIVTDAIDGFDGSASVTVNPANTATHFLVSAPTSAHPGVPFSFTVQALNASNTQATYDGTISFSSSDPSATLPGSAVLDSGVATFSATLETLGNRTITVTDGDISGSDTVAVVSAASEDAESPVVYVFPVFSIHAPTAPPSQPPEQAPQAAVAVTARASLTG